MSVEADLERMNAWAWNAESAPHWVCEVDGRVVGWASMLMPARDASLGEDVAEIVACYVRPALWGRGLGRRLITTALDAARSFAHAGVLQLEGRHGDEVAAALKARGHDLEYPSIPIGGGQAILRDLETGYYTAGSDPRKDGQAIGF